MKQDVLALPGPVAEPRTTDEATRMAPKQLPDGYHLALSVSQQLWTDLLGEALPIQVGQGDWDLVEQGKRLLEAAETQVKGLLGGVEQKLDEAPVVGGRVGRRLRGGLRSVARKGADVARGRLKDAVAVRGKWRARVSKDGSRFSYHDGGVTLDARAVLEIEGRALLFGEQFEIPFTLSRNVDGTASLEDVSFSRDRKQLEGSVKKVSLSLGNSLPMRVLKLVGDRVLEQQVQKINPVPLIPGSTLEKIILPAEGPLKLSASIDDLNVGINQKDLTLSVRFAFKGVGAAA
jgi:hypothetical protein